MVFFPILSIQIIFLCWHIEKGGTWQHVNPPIYATGFRILYEAPSYYQKQSGLRLQRGQLFHRCYWDGFAA